MGKEETITTPSSMGGLQRFNEEYPSKVQISPETVTIIIGIVILGIAAIKLWIPIA
jgi:preprotein translocase subunit Sec61beta